MVVDNIRLEESSEHCFLTARVRTESDPASSNDLWFRFPATLRPMLTPSADAFLVATLLPAMVQEKRLVIEGEVCPRLLESCRQIQDIFATWLENARRIPIEAGRRASPAHRPGHGVGSFFSAGVDSFHTLLKNLDHVTHLLLIDRFDYKMISSDAVCRNTREHVTRVAEGFGKQLIISQTNARLLFVPGVGWNFYHGAALAAMGLAMGNLFERIYIPASYTYNQLHPWGSHPLLDPLWTTHETRFIHDGAESTRSQKVMDWICRSDLALNSLRVCLKAGDDYNCGQCEKCLRTMIPIYLAGKLGRTPIFPRELPVEAIENHMLRNLGQYQFAEENIALLEKKVDQTALDRQLLRALRGAIQRSRAKVARREAKLARRERRKKLFGPGPLIEKLRLLAG